MSHHLGASGCLPCLIIQTIRRDPSGSVWVDDPYDVNRPDRSGADQIDVEHQATDLVLRISRLPWLGLESLHSAGTPTPGSEAVVCCRRWAAEQAFQYSRLTRPCCNQHVPGDLPGRVPQRERDHQHVIQWSDHRQELRHQVEG